MQPKKHGIKISNLSIGATAIIVESRQYAIDNVVYRAAEDWFVNLTRPWDVVQHKGIVVVPTAFDTVITRMPTALWTGSDEFVTSEEMACGHFGVICDEGKWHGGFILKATSIVVHLSNSGSRIARWTPIEKVMPIDMMFIERV